MENKDTISLKTIVVNYLRQWKLFLIVFVISFIPAILYLKLYPRTYEFAAGILLQDEQESALSGFGLGEAASLMKSFGIGGSTGSINVDDEMEILASNRMLRMLVLDLGLNIAYSKPYSFYKMYQEAPLILTGDSGVLANIDEEYRLKVSVAQGNIKVKVKSYPGGFSGVYSYTSLPALIKAGPHEFKLDFDNDGAQKNAFKLNIRVSPASWIAENLSKQIEIEDVSSISNVLSLQCSEHARQRGLDILNGLIRIYNRDSKSFQNTEDYKTMAFVDERIAKVVEELAEVETSIGDFKTKNEMTLLEADVTLYAESFKELQTTMIETEIQLYHIEFLDQYVKDPENKYKAVPSFLSSEGEKGTVAEYNKAIAEQERILSVSNEYNESYLNAKVKADLLREAVHVSIENAMNSTAKALDELKSKEKQLLSKMKSIPEKEREYVNLVRDQDILQGIYLILLQKKEETLMSLGKQMDRARFIEPAYIKKKPLGPRKLYAGIGMLVLTLVLPVGYLFAKSLFIAIREEYRHTE